MEFPKLYLPLHRKKDEKIERGRCPSFYSKILFQLKLITENTIRALVAEKIADTEYYLLSVDIRPGNVINVELESMGPVSILDCVDISRQIEHNLDREAEDFSLQVSSPGLDKPLRDYRQYIKNIGRELKIKLTNDEEIQGELLKADAEKIEVKETKKVRVDGKSKKEIVEINHVLAYSEIKQAKIIITFK